MEYWLCSSQNEGDSVIPSAVISHIECRPSSILNFFRLALGTIHRHRGIEKPCPCSLRNVGVAHYRFVSEGIWKRRIHFVAPVLQSKIKGSLNSLA